MRALLQTFIPLFVAVDVVAVVLVYLGIGLPTDKAEGRRLVLEATVTAAAAGIGFLLAARMMCWRKRLYAFMAWNASSATDFFRVPPDRVVQLGGLIEL